MKKIIATLTLSLAIAALIVLALFAGSQKPATLAGGSSVDTFDSTSVFSITVSTTPITVVSESPFRKYVQIQNNSYQTLFCLLEGNATSGASVVTSTPQLEKGFRLAATSTNNQGSFYEIRGYIGNINCTYPIGSAGKTNVSATITTSP